MDPLNNNPMNNPVSNQMFTHDYQKYVLQDQNARTINSHMEFQKPFNIKAPDKSDKAKKDIKKEKEKPFTFKKTKDATEEE